MEIKCTEARNEGGRREDGGGEGEVGEERRKNVRFIELGKLKVIKSEDYSTAKLLKFLREVVGFRPVLSSKALRCQHVHIIHNFLYPAGSFLYVSILSSSAFHPAGRPY